MIKLVVGKPDSGKSLLAEKLCLQLAGNNRKYYIATMIPYGDEGKKRVEKHRKMRSGKGFETLEWPSSLEKRLGETDFANASVLLECMSNLVGNELYHEDNLKKSDEEIVDLILSSVKSLEDKALNLVIVTNEFPLEDSGYDDETRRYVKVIFMVNEELKKLSSQIYQYEEGEWVKYENN